jgi:hypothetical protein
MPTNQACTETILFILQNGWLICVGSRLHQKEMRPEIPSSPRGNVRTRKGFRQHGGEGRE